MPAVHEDDALRAARAAVELRAALDGLNEELERRWGARLEVRTGVHTGDVVAGDPASGQSFVSGDAVNVAARLEQAARPGEILIGSETHRLIRDAVRVEPVEPLALKGKSAPVPAFRLLEVVPGAPALARRLDSPMVGRDAELQQLLGAFERAVGGPACELVTVLGVAGVGKSRLIQELRTGLPAQALVLKGRCLPYGEGITFWPVAEIVRQAAGIVENDRLDDARTKIGTLLAGHEAEEASLIRDRIGAVIGLGKADGGIQQTFWAVRRLLEGLAAEHPVVAVVDDIHWAEPTLLDLLEYIAGFSRDHPLLLVCTARPELQDARPDWGMTGTTLALRPLGAGESEHLIGNLLGRTLLPGAALTRIVEASEGNPLFAEEMLRMLIDDGFLRRDDGHWIITADLAQVSAPRTIQALIGARLDRLQEQERAVIQRAAVVGRIFYWGAVTDLSPEDTRGGVGGHLQTLQRKELIQPEPSAFAGEDAFRFSHILVRDAAYESMPKRTRADLHERLASWIERVAGARVAEYEEILGYHLEQAHRYLADLGPVDEHGEALASRASSRLASAGSRFFSIGDMTAAATLYSRAVDLLPTGAQERVHLLTELGAALTETGEWRKAEAVLTEALDAAADVGDRRSEALALVRSLYIGLHTLRFAENVDALPDLERAIATFEELGDDAGLAEAWTMLGTIQFWQGQASLAVETMERVIALARRADDRRRELEGLRWRSMAEALGPTPVDEAARRLASLMGGLAATDPVLRASLGRYRTELEAMRGDFALAGALAHEAKAAAREFGLEIVYAGVLRATGFSAILAGDPVRAELELREAVEILRRRGDLGHLSSVAPLLAEALDAQGRHDEVGPVMEEARRAQLEGDMDAQVQWRRVQAKILAGRGGIDEAVRVATEGADLARRTDYLDVRGMALMALAEVLELAGRGPEATPVAREALETFERNGASALAERARTVLARLEGRT